MFKILGVIGFLLAWFGFIGPACVSASSDALVVGWYSSTAILAVVSVKIIIRKIKGDTK